LDRMWSQPSRGWPMAVFAADSVADIEGLRPLLRLDGQRMAGEAFLVLVGRKLQPKNLPHPDGDVVRKNLIGAGMFVLARPDAVCVLRDAQDDLGLNAAVATAGGATSGAVVLTDRGSLSSLRGSQRQAREDERCERPQLRRRGRRPTSVC